MSDHLSPNAAPSRRVAWVDIARVFTMLCTMLTHSPVLIELKRKMWFTGSGRMCLLFVVAGYFMARSKSASPGWFPQAGRAKRMILAYVFLIVLYIVLLGWTPYWNWQVLDPLFSGNPGETLDVLERLFGIGDQPPGPFWFLRDLIILTLACQGFVWLKGKGWLLLICLALLCFGKELACNHFRIMGEYQVIHPREIAFFALGVCLSSISLHEMGEYIRKRSVLIMVTAFVLLYYEWKTISHPSPMGIIFYMLAVCTVALFVERKWPVAGRWIAGLGESVFLVYVLHMLFISLIWQLVKLWYKNPEAMLPGWAWFLIVPVLYLGIHYLGMGIKKISPRLFDIIAIRPPRKKEGARS